MRENVRLHRRLLTHGRKYVFIKNLIIRRMQWREILTLFLA